MFIKVLHLRHKLLKIPMKFLRQCSTNVNKAPVSDNNLDEFKDWKEKLHSNMTIYENFISDEEEKSLLDELEPYLKRMRYEYSHWDNMIHGYRETEFIKWNEENTKIIDKVRQKAFPPGMPQLKFVHVLDLAENGWIKPHVDSPRFCGEVIATISLLSDCIMRLTYVGHENEYWNDFLIPRKSLYVMKGVARHKYNHEVIKSVNRSRRISVICRCEPV